MISIVVANLVLTKATFASQAKGDPQAKNASALRFGILGAARIGPTAFIEPARTHPDVIVAAVACRDKERGEQYAQKHGIVNVDEKRPESLANLQAVQSALADAITQRLRANRSGNRRRRTMDSSCRRS